jgi:hypothetical protein
MTFWDVITSPLVILMIGTCIVLSIMCVWTVILIGICQIIYREVTRLGNVRTKAKIRFGITGSTMDTKFFWYVMDNGKEAKVYFSDIEDLASDLGDDRRAEHMSDDEFYRYVHMLMED